MSDDDNSDGEYYAWRPCASDEECGGWWSLDEPEGTERCSGCDVRFCRGCAESRLKPKRTTDSGRYCRSCRRRKDERDKHERRSVVPTAMGTHD